MDGPFLSPRAKRSIHGVTGMHEANAPYANANGVSSKRSKPPPPPLTVPSGHVLFRLLCRMSLSGGVIGKSGTIIKQIQQETAAKIRVEESPPGADERVIVVIASNAVNKKIALKASKSEEEGSGVQDEVVEVSAAQEALIRVFERILDVMVEIDGESLAPGSVVSCRLLAESSQAGAVIGKGGKVIEKIRNDTGCKIRVTSSDKLPVCALPKDELVEIEGDILAVKKALVTVSRRLQDSPPIDKGKTSGSRSFEAVSQETLPKAIRSVPYASGDRHLSIEAERGFAWDSRTQQQEVVFRLLCSNDRVGGVIGKGGTIVKALENETGASITVGAPIPDCDERLITFTAMESPESQYSPSQRAIVLVFNRSIEAGIEKGLDTGPSKGSPVSARVIVPSNQVGCLLGKGGAIMSQMRKETGAGISIIRHDQVPRCASENEDVVQITGEFRSVQDALYNVTSRLRYELCFSSRMPNGVGTRSISSIIPEMSPYEKARDHSSLGFLPSVGVSRNLNRHPTLSHTMDHLGLSHNYDLPPSPTLWASQTVGGFNPRSIVDVGTGRISVSGGVQLSSGSRTAIVTNTTVEIAVPENVVGSIYGENGSNLNRLRQISGAKVMVHEPAPGTSGRIVVISGTPDETQAAQSLLQAFILTGPS